MSVAPAVQTQTQPAPESGIRLPYAVLLGAVGILSGLASGVFAAGIARGGETTRLQAIERRQDVREGDHERLVRVEAAVAGMKEQLEKIDAKLDRAIERK